MPVHQQPAWILHARPWRETSLLLDAFTRDHGRVGLLARGVRRERSRIPRSLLQPLRPLLLDWSGRHELVTLGGADLASAPLTVGGEGLLSAMYVNELVLRLTARGETQTAAFAAYGQCLARLAATTADTAWTLRRFERDLLADLGHALAPATTADGSPVEAGLEYACDPAGAPEPWREGSPWPRVRGATLLALQADTHPGAAGLSELRRLVRATVRHLLGRDLVAWSMAARRR